MPSGISKRQQLRHEKILAELIRTVPGNDRCADCDALTPGWASWNMGIFLCMRCAAIHRKLGTHISKVKSLSMDTWSSEQVDNMKSHGNMLMNKIFNPKNVKPPVPTDIDEADSCMERFIRQKYQYRSLEDGKPKPPSREDASYTRTPDSRPSRARSPSGSPEGSPPPLPPKTGSKFFGFGLRGSSSTSNLRRFGTKSSKGSPNPDLERWSPEPTMKNRERGLGAPVADVTTASFESKMAAMREMGFTNDRRNEMVLRGLNEDLDRSVETLARLGEGNGAPMRARTPAATSTTAPAPAQPARAVTPNPPKPETSNNPFERSVSNPVVQQQPQSATASYNPFDRPNPTPVSAQPLETSFQNLQVSQPLFPHSTGGHPNRANSVPQPASQPMYQPPFAPSATFGQNQGGYVSSPQSMDNSYNPFFQTAPQPQGGVASQTFSSPSAAQNNPFFNNAAPQNQSMQQTQQPAAVPNLSVPRPPQHANTMPAMPSNSPFGTSPFGPTPSFPQQQQQQQPQQLQQATNAAQGSYNPFQQAMGPTTPQSAGPFTTQNQFQSQQFQPQQQQPQQLQQPQQPQQPQQLVPQTTGQMDKNSILSLYNLAPSPAVPPIPQQFQSQPQAQAQPQFQQGMGTSPVPPLTNSLNTTPQTQPGSSVPTPQPQSNAPPIASRNPFGAANVGSGLAAQAGVTPSQLNQPSSGLGIGMGTNGTAQSQPQPQIPAPTGMKTSAPFAGGSSPFSSSPFSGPPPSNLSFPRTHMSQPSVDVNNLQNGRHSPDAFASLSARYG
ncbi:hypothetical protein N7532_009540 [Penicillium argentinense]|uniref:Arf-GAP domain-containing protein n=1 Tax=Penicillium argentinense TaxID=1131581 RepID=A0A9W9K325_9EURO|nr:uncharacterized protein N7532_009540 [Penicillium argentinense]KAJ5090856.1 hypothetical protein N7532_009540 [Penicillium argentinense]